MNGERERLMREAVELLDRIEISSGLETFDGSIAGGPPMDVDLFAPGPKYFEWERAVRANRRARAALGESQRPEPARYPVLSAEEAAAEEQRRRSRGWVPPASGGYTPTGPAGLPKPPVGGTGASHG